MRRLAEMIVKQKSGSAEALSGRSFKTVGRCVADPGSNVTHPRCEFSLIIQIARADNLPFLHNLFRFRVLFVIGGERY
ncbi:hypothetical protein SAMN03159448_04928 [Sinorhizobium sp. NFACC03]|nr:hypothetical protein SAMN03159448_04928 [Sinorhizobium sp. NFACC03]